MVIPAEGVAAPDATRVICGRILLRWGRSDSANLYRSFPALFERLVAFATRYTCFWPFFGGLAAFAPLFPLVTFSCAGCSCMIALGSFMGSFSFRDGSYCSSLHLLDTLFCTYTPKKGMDASTKKLKRENNHQNTVFSRSLKSLLWRRHSLDRKVGPEHCTLLAFWGVLAFFFI
jgi:hypothetical protein